MEKIRIYWVAVNRLFYNKKGILLPGNERDTKLHIRRPNALRDKLPDLEFKSDGQSITFDTFCDVHRFDPKRFPEDWKTRTKPFKIKVHTLVTEIEG
jgi:hypothetical protein